MSDLIACAYPTWLTLLSVFVAALGLPFIWSSWKRSR